MKSTRKRAIWKKDIFGSTNKGASETILYFSKLKSQEFQKGREVVISYELNVYSTVKKLKVKGVLLLNEMVLGVVYVCFLFLYLLS